MSRSKAASSFSVLEKFVAKSRSSMTAFNSSSAISNFDFSETHSLLCFLNDLRAIASILHSCSRRRMDSFSASAAEREERGESDNAAYWGDSGLVASSSKKPCM